MLILRLFSKDQPDSPVDARIIDDEAITIGRDHSSDWVISDPDNQISRVHCSVQNWNSQLVLTDTSSNGVFLHDGKKRVCKNSPYSIEPGQRFYLGSYFVEIDLPSNEKATDKTSIVHLKRTDERGNVLPQAPALQTIPADSNSTDGTLLAAFCRGAGIDVSLLVDEEASAIMERAGSIYREVLTGIGRLIEERAISREVHNMDRTTIGGVDNNPFKWAPGQCLSVDLLKESQAGFLRADQAIQQCFQDIDAHMRATESAVDGAVQGILAAIEPALVAKEIETGFNLKSRPKKCWDHYVQLHSRLSSDAVERRSAFENSFRRSYNEAMDRDPNGRSL